MKKISLDQAWLCVIRGDEIISMDRKLRLQAKLVRSALLKEKNRIDSLSIDDKKILNNIYQEFGIIKKEKLNFASISKWITILFLGGGLVYATKTVLHFTNFQNTPNISKPEKTANVITNDKQNFWTTWFGPSGISFNVFWPKPYDQGIETENSNCSSTHLIFSECLKLANQNNANAQFNIALMYEQGLQTEQSYQMAFEWYKKSAALGNTQAQFNIDYLIKNNLIP